MTLRIGCSHRAFAAGTPADQIVAIAARAGLRDLELAASTIDGATARVIAEEGCRVHALSLPSDLLPAAERDRAIANAAETAARLGSGCLVWDGRLANATPDAEGWAETLSAIATAARLCAEQGVRLAIVNSPAGPVRDIRSAMAFTARLPELAPAGALGCALDIGAAFAVGANPFLLAATMEETLAAVFLAAADGDRRVLPHAGETPWPALIRAIAATGFDGPLLLAGLAGDSNDLAAARDVLDPMIAAIDADGDPCASPPPPGVLEGIRRFNAGDYHGAHEDLEHEWHAERRPVRRLYQGILQIGVGLHHARGGNHRGAVALLTDGIEKTSGFLPSCQGIDTARLVRESQRCLDRIIELGPAELDAFDWSLAPLVHRTAPADDQAS